MTDLTKMSVDDLETCVLARTTGWAYEAAAEMARRLREQEQELEQAAYDKAALVREVENQQSHRLHAESSLLACQAREGELREAASGLVDFLLDSSVTIGPFTSRSGYPLQLVVLKAALSHSTGSKIMAAGSNIMAVVEAVKGHYEWHQKHDTETTCAICETYRALKEK